MSDFLWPQKIKCTNDLTKEDAESVLDGLTLFTDSFIKKNHKFYVDKGMWPLKAAKKNAGDKDPKFFVIHHTSNKDRNYKPAMARFFQAKMASSNFLVTENGSPLYIVDIKDASYHATLNTFLPLAARRQLGIESKWLNEVGIEVAGNGNTKFFTHDQLLSSICIGRTLRAKFENLKEVKSHKFFSPIHRSGDPGPTFMLALVEHAIFHDIDLENKEYWLSIYKKNPFDFMFDTKLGQHWIDALNLKERDEWYDKRAKIKIKDSFV